MTFQPVSYSCNVANKIKKHTFLLLHKKGFQMIPMGVCMNTFSQHLMSFELVREIANKTAVIIFSIIALKLASTHHTPKKSPVSFKLIAHLFFGILELHSVLLIYSNYPCGHFRFETIQLKIMNGKNSRTDVIDGTCLLEDGLT